MISVVNGFVCSSSCDVEKAKQGKDPNAPPGTPPGTSGTENKTTGFDNQPATVLDGALKDPLTVNAVTASDGSQAPGGVQQASVNLLV
jgi:hypothetical protein